MNRMGERESCEGSMIKKGESGLVVSSLVAKGIHIEPMKFTKTTKKKKDAKEQLRFLIHAHINPHLHTYIYKHYNTETPKLI